MKPDITTREDIKRIISEFYDKLLNDENISHFFQEFVQQNTLEKHLEIITDFWEDIIFQTYKYKSNPIKKHLDFNKKMKFSKEHFKTWLNYFLAVIDKKFEGENTSTLKNRAQSIATVMQLKMDLYKTILR